MERDLFYILQNIKIDINCLKIDYLQKRLEEVNNECMHEEDSFNYYNKKFFLNNLRFLLIKIFMLGNCTKNQIDKYALTRNSLENILDKIEENYNLLFTELTIIEGLLEVNKNKEESLKNNFKQINLFFDYINDLSKEEKKKIFSYKMGENNG